MSIAFVSGDYNNQIDPPSPNGCAYYRQTLPAQALRDRGVDVTIGQPRVHSEHGIGVAEGDGGIFGFDTTVLKLLMHQSVPGLINLMRQRGERVIVDVDDFHFAMHEENVAFRGTDPRVNPENNRAHYERSMRYADVVTVATDYLANFYSRRCRDVRVIRNSVVVEDFTPVEQPEVPTFGWIGGTLWRSGDIETLESWLPGFAKRYGVGVHHVGHIPNDANHFGARAGLARVATSPMCLVRDVPKALQNIHVGLVPLTSNPFNESKSFLKGLEYAASGIPFIASPTDEYLSLARDGVGRIAYTPDEWVDHATELLDRDLRVAEGQRIREVVLAKHDISVRGASWVTALSS